MNDEIDGNLMTSETGLIILNDSEFSIHSWHMGDHYMDYAVNLITDSYYNLYRRNIIIIEPLVKVYTLFKFKPWTRIKYSARLNKTKEYNCNYGWFEKKVINSICYGSNKDLDTLISDVFAEILKKGTGSYTNPAKEFFKYALENQKQDFFQFEIITSFWGDKIRIWQEGRQIARFEKIRVNQWDCEHSYFDISILWNKIRKELEKYIDRGG